MAFLLVKLENQLPLEEQIIVVNDYNILVTSQGKKVGDVVNLAFPENPNVKYSAVVLYKGTKKACNVQRDNRLKALSDNSSSSRGQSQEFSIPGSTGHSNDDNRSQNSNGSETQWPTVASTSTSRAQDNHRQLQPGRVLQVHSQVNSSQNLRDSQSQRSIMNPNVPLLGQKPAAKSKKIVPSDSSRKVFQSLMDKKSAIVVSENSMLNARGSLHLQKPPDHGSSPNSSTEDEDDEGIRRLINKKKQTTRMIYSSSRSPSPLRRRQESRSPSRRRSRSRSSGRRRSRSRSRVEHYSRSRSNRRHTQRSRSPVPSSQSQSSFRGSPSRNRRSNSRHSHSRSFSRQRSRSHDFHHRSGSSHPNNDASPHRSRSRSRRSGSRQPRQISPNTNQQGNQQQQEHESQDLFSQSQDYNGVNEAEKTMASTVDDFQRRIKYLNEKLARLEAQQQHKSCEESVQILRRVFPHHARANDNNSDPSKVKIGERTEISRVVHTLTNWADPLQAVQELAVAFFGRDVLISHSVSGNVGPINKGEAAKPALPEEPLIDIINEVIMQYKSSNSDSLKIKIGNIETTVTSKLLRGAVMKKTYSLCGTARRQKKKAEAARLANAEGEDDL